MPGKTPAPGKHGTASTSTELQATKAGLEGAWKMSLGQWRSFRGHIIEGEAFMMGWDGMGWDDQVFERGGAGPQRYPWMHGRS